MTVDSTDATPETDADGADEPDADGGDEPADDSYLMGATGVQAQVEAEMARAEAELSGEAPPDDDRGAEV
jgi:hypothetical protein